MNFGINFMRGRSYATPTRFSVFFNPPYDCYYTQYHIYMAMSLDSYQGLYSKVFGYISSHVTKNIEMIIPWFSLISQLVVMIFVSL